MKSVKKFLYLIIFIGLLVSELGKLWTEPTKSTTCKNVTVEYPASVPDHVAKGIAETTVEGDLSSGRTIRVEVFADADNYRLKTSITENAVSQDTRSTFQLFARVMTDRYSPDKPILIEVTSKDGQRVVEVVRPVGPMGKVTTYDGDYLFYNAEISEEDAGSIAEGLRRIGYFSGGTSIARVIRAENEFIVHLAYDGDLEKFESDEFQRSMASDVQLLKNELFSGAATKLVCSELNMQPIGEVVATADGLIPGQMETRVDNMVIVHDESTTTETATAIATRFPARNANESEFQITLTGNGSTFECRIDSSADHAEQCGQVATFWGREIFSEMPNAQSLKVMFVDSEGTVLLTRDISSRHGHYLTLKQNRLLYPSDTPELTIENLQKGLQSVGLFRESDASLSRLTHHAEGYKLQIAIPPDTDTTGIDSELQSIGRCVAETAFPETHFVIEITDFDFVPFDNCTWKTGGRVSAVQPIATQR